MNQENNPTEINYAGFWIRTLAFLLDAIIISVISYFLFGDAVVKMQSGSVNVNFTDWYNLIPFLYTIIFWTYMSATPGKWICGLKIIQSDGTKLSIKKALLRYISYLISGFVFMAGFFTIAFSSKKQGWHDMIAKTYVVKTRK